MIIWVKQVVYNQLINWFCQEYFYIFFTKHINFHIGWNYKCSLSWYFYSSFFNILFFFFFFVFCSCFCFFSLIRFFCFDCIISLFGLSIFFLFLFCLIIFFLGFSFFFFAVFFPLLLFLQLIAHILT